MATIEVKKADSQGGGSVFIQLDSDKTYTADVNSDFDKFSVVVAGGGTGANGVWEIDLLSGDADEYKNGQEAAGKSTVIPNPDVEINKILMADAWAGAMTKALSSGEAVLSLVGYAMSSNAKQNADNCDDAKQSNMQKLMEAYTESKSNCEESDCVEFRMPWGGIISSAKAEEIGEDGAVQMATAAGNARNQEPCYRPALRIVTDMKSIQFSSE